MLLTLIQTTQDYGNPFEKEKKVRSYGTFEEIIEWFSIACKLNLPSWTAIVYNVSCLTDFVHVRKFIPVADILKHGDACRPQH